MHGSVGHWRLLFPQGQRWHVLSGPGPLLSPPRGKHAQAGGDLHAISVSHEWSPHMLTRPLPVLQMAPSEGTVTQIGLLSQDIHRLTVGPWLSPQ